MEGVAALRVPLAVKVQAGERWGSMAPVGEPYKAPACGALHVIGLGM